MNNKIKLFFQLLLVLWAGLAGAQSNDLPNIILIMSDDQGYQETSYNKHPLVKTPVLDEMADNSLRFDQFYAQSPICTPTRASIITGRHANRSGAFCWNYSTRPEEISIAQLAKQAGYATAHFGKWHIGPSKKDSPTSPGAMGFDEWLSHDNYFGVNPVMSKNGETPEEIRGESSEIIVEAAMEFIGRATKEDKPFFVVIWFGSPHSPYAASDQDLMPYWKERKKFLKDGGSDMLLSRYAEIAAMDRSLGWLREYLKEEEVKDNTMLWFTSDNGTSKDAVIYTELRGHKGNLYQGGILVPAVIEWPKVIKKPMQSSFSAVTTDIFPTVCDIMGVKLPERPLDGTSLCSIWERGMQERSSPIYFWQTPEAEGQKLYGDDYPLWIPAEQNLGNTPTSKREGIQFVNFKFENISWEDLGGQMAVIEGDFKLIEQKDGSLELYNLNMDPYEKDDIADQEVDKVKEMQKSLRKWQNNVMQSLAGKDY